MKTREQITAEILQQHKLDCDRNAKADHYKRLAEEEGQAHVDKLLAEWYGYTAVIRAEVQKRLTGESHLTCEDFDHFDVNCCNICHTCYPHYEIWVVKLSDGRHAWVCDPIKDILMRQTGIMPVPPEVKKALKLLDEIFGGSDPDPIRDSLHDGAMAASSDEEKLYYCLKYAHHLRGRKRGDEPLEELVSQALRLPGRGPAQSAKFP